MIHNPILAGFNPDPSFLRVGEDYYIATSTFEWYPGVQIFHSRDLVNWDLVARPLNRAALLDMRGNPDSCGIWAPCLSHDGDRFYLVYTDVKRYDGAFKDAPNYITACETIDGEWCDPWYVNSSGFDPSLFHDDDGRKWFMNMQWNHRGEGTGGNPKNSSFDGILLQEWSPERGLFGPVKNVYAGTERGLTEAPHMFKRNGYYYLTTAEGGTAYDHAVTLARSRDIWGPYEDHPDLFVMSTKDVPLAQSAIQRTGHGQYVETPDGQVYHTFLMGRPITGPDGTGMYCPLGRETGIERCVWKDDWLYLEAGGLVPRAQVEGLADVAPRAPKDVVTEFAGQTLPSDFQWLRHPHPERLFRVDNGLHVIGRESFGSWFENALVARRQEHHVCTVETTVAFDPVSYQQSAGLTHYYNRFKFHKLLVSLEPDVGRCLRIVSCLGDYPDAALTWTPDMVPLADGPVELRAQIDNAALQFAWRLGGDWINIGPVLDASLISDEGGRGAHGSFTGAFLGMYVMDMTGQGREALFSRFAYLPKGA
ncbi:glycoside hydrolase family 43 protein [Celeribacter marinus]|uniref:Beta-xylosidase n=1 Tax=Celeribacter marinus TaxID=1397108 RepID=A0A0P0A1V4_9RHOB|nr:glycoside hydrolase family 43 protein [Celeribacter marinus]ALI54194.1 beta-xylosidase [Celeribacter marinus]SFK31355.1 xylan 1,4-beta-xylosidase [Celeribacter marinus]